MSIDVSPAARWEGLYLGTRTLGPREIDRACRTLLGHGLLGLPARAAAVLRPPPRATTSRNLFLHSASPTKRSLECDLESAGTGGPREVSAYVEARAVGLARPGDAVVCRPAFWQAAGAPDHVRHVGVEDGDHYYLTHALLAAAMRGNGRDPTCRALAQLFGEPAQVVRVYCLDTETQILLLHFARLAGVPEVYTDANAPTVASTWGAKDALHPDVRQAGELPTTPDPEAMLQSEFALTRLGRLLPDSCAALPGYTLPARASERASTADLCLAARLLRERYRLVRACLKPAAGGGGMRVIPDLHLEDRRQLRASAGRISTFGEPYVLEAQVSYASTPLPRGVVAQAPSAHIRGGVLAPGATLQLVQGASWRGNVYVDASSCSSVGLPTTAYREVRVLTRRLLHAFAAAGLHLETAGFDFAYGRIGGRFGSRTFVALQDPNLSFTGAEFLRGFRTAVGGSRSAATRVVLPTADGTLATLRRHAADFMCTVPSGVDVAVLYALPHAAAMLAASGSSPGAALDTLFRWEHRLVEDELVVDEEGRP